MVVVGAYVLLWVAVVVAAGDNDGALVVWGLLSVPAFLCFLVWFWVRLYYLPVPALMLEPVGVFGALGRGFALTRRQFWRTFGIALLTVLVVGIAPTCRRAGRAPRPARESRSPARSTHW